MHNNEKYFNRLRGHWEWTAQFEWVDFGSFLKSRVKWSHKIKALMMMWTQIIFGPFHMKSQVEVPEKSNLVLHRLEIYKWGLVFYRSHKQFTLDPNGSGLSLQGEEYFWPFLNWPKHFKDYKAHVAEDATSAVYEWPLFETKVYCETKLDSENGFINLNSDWIRCTFKLTPLSMSELKRRDKI